MGVRLKGVVGLGCVVLGVLGASTAWAQQATVESQQLDSLTVPGAIDAAAGLNTFSKDQSVLGDALFTFGLDNQEKRINRAGARIEAVYLDLLQQQDDDNPIVRTRDLANPFSTSLHQLNNPTVTSDLIIDNQLFPQP